MAYVMVNVAFNESDGVDRKTIIFEQDFNKIEFLVCPKDNFYLWNGEDKSLFTIEKIDGSYKIIKFVETIFIDNLKVFDYSDYDFCYSIVDGKLVCKLDPKINIDVPELYAE